MSSGIGSGYDLSASTYSPDGRIFQVEYAYKAVEAAGTVVAIRAKDGVVLACQNLKSSKLMVPGGNKKIGSVDMHVGMIATGVQADARHLIQRARQEAKEYKSIYKTAVPAKIIAERLGQYVQAHTLYSSVRPFGVATVLAAMDLDGPALYLIEPSGIYYGYKGCAVGKGKQLAKTEVEKLKLGELDARQAVKEAARIIYAAHDEAKDKDFELELSWVCEESKGKHEFVPKDLALEAEKLAKEALEHDDMEEDE